MIEQLAMIAAMVIIIVSMKL